MAILCFESMMAMQSQELNTKINTSKSFKSKYDQKATIQSSDLESGNNEALEFSRARNETTLFDFSRLHSVDNWVEQSDTVREVGKSKAVLVLQKTKVFQRAVFFFLLNPQPNGAGFAGVRISTSLDLHSYENIALKVRRQGNNSGYKIVLRHKGLNDEPHPTYEQFFTVSVNQFQVVNLPLVDFRPYYRGRPLNESEVGSLDTRNITSFGVQVYGGVYLPVKQSGPSTLEVDWIKATNTNEHSVTLI